MRTSLPKLKEILLATIAVAFALTLTLGLTACGQQTGASEEGASSGRLNETKLFEDTAAQEGEGPATNVGMDDAIPLLGGLRFSYIAQTGLACTSRVT